MHFKTVGKKRSLARFDFLAIIHLNFGFGVTVLLRIEAKSDALEELRT